MKLLYIHGAGSCGLAFHYQTQRFPGSEAIDLPGHPVGKPCDSIEGYLEWVRGFSAARSYQDLVLCGHSMGGAITMLYALRYPEEVRGIVLVGSGGPPAGSSRLSAAVPGAGGKQLSMAGASNGRLLSEGR